MTQTTDYQIFEYKTKYFVVSKKVCNFVTKNSAFLDAFRFGAE